MRKILSLIMVVALVFTLAACNNKDDVTPDTTVDGTTEGGEEGAIEGAEDASVSSTSDTIEGSTDGADDGSTATSEPVEITPFVDVEMISGDDGISVMLSRVNYMVYQIKSFYEQQYGPQVWDELVTEEETVEEMILGEIKNILIRTEISLKLAEEQGLSLTDEEIADFEAQAAEMFSYLPDDVILSMGISAELITNSFIEEGYSRKIYDDMLASLEYDEDKLEESLATDVTYQKVMGIGIEEYVEEVRARHILIKNTDAEGNKLEGEALEDAIALIEELRQRALDGEDFATLAIEYTEDPGSKENGGEYTFGRGIMVPEFEAAAYALEIGGISEVVETSYGYHVLMLEERIPGTEEALAEINERLDGIKQNYITQLQFDAYTDTFEELALEYNVQLNEEEWAKITMK